MLQVRARDDDVVPSQRREWNLDLDRGCWILDCG
jgi:hypothetical protein